MDKNIDSLSERLGSAGLNKYAWLGSLTPQQIREFDIFTIVHNIRLHLDIDESYHDSIASLDNLPSLDDIKSGVFTKDDLLKLIGET